MEKFSKEDYLVKKVVPFKPNEVKNIEVIEYLSGLILRHRPILWIVCNLERSEENMTIFENLVSSN